MNDKVMMLCIIGVFIAISGLFCLRKKLKEWQRNRRILNFYDNPAQGPEMLAIEFMARLAIGAARLENMAPVSKHFRHARDVYMRDLSGFGVRPIMIDSLFRKVKGRARAIIAEEAITVEEILAAVDKNTDA